MQEFINHIIRKGDKELLDEYKDHIPKAPELLWIPGVSLETIKWAKDKKMAGFITLSLLPSGLPFDLVKAMAVHKLIRIQNLPVDYLPARPARFLREIGATDDLIKQIISWLPEIKQIPPSEKVGIDITDILVCIFKHTKDIRAINKASEAIAQAYKTWNLEELGAITDTYRIKILLNYLKGRVGTTYICLQIATRAAEQGNLALVKYLAKKVPDTDLSVLYGVMQENKKAYPVLRWLIERHRGHKYTTLPLRMIPDQRIAKEWLVEVANCDSAVVDLAFKVIDKIQQTNQEIPENILVNATGVLEAICQLSPSLELAEEAIGLGAELSVEDPESSETYWLPMEYSCNRKNKEMVDYLHKKGSMVTCSMVNEDKEFTEWLYIKYRKEFIDVLLWEYITLYNGLIKYGHTKIILSELIAGRYPPPHVDKSILIKQPQICALICATDVTKVMSSRQAYSGSQAPVASTTRNYRYFKRLPHIFPDIKPTQAIPQTKLL